MTQNRTPAVDSTETEAPKKKFSVSIPRSVVTHVASFFAGAATYAGVQKLKEDVNLDATVTYEPTSTTVIDV